MPDEPIPRPIASPAPRLDQYDVYVICLQNGAGYPLAVLGTEADAEAWLQIYNMNRDDSEQVLWIGYNLGRTP